MARASDTLGPSPRVDDVAEAVPHQVDGQRKQSDYSARDDDRPPVAQRGEIQSEVRNDAEFGDEDVAREEAYERQGREDDDHGPDVERNLDENRRQHIRLDVTKHD